MSRAEQGKQGVGCHLCPPTKGRTERQHPAVVSIAGVRLCDGHRMRLQEITGVDIPRATGGVIPTFGECVKERRPRRSGRPRRQAVQHG